MNKGRFGAHGGHLFPKRWMHAVTELETAYNHYKRIGLRGGAEHAPKR